MNVPVTSDTQHTLLIVDDEENVLHALLRLLRSDGYRILTAVNGEAALAQLAANEVHVILSDQRMPGMPGTELLGIAREKYPDAIRMMLTGYTELTTVTEAVNRGGIYKFLVKPWDDALLQRNIREAFEQYDLSQKTSQITQIFENTVEGILITSPLGIIHVVNPAFSAITGYSSAEVVGRSPDFLAPPPEPAMVRDIGAALGADGKWGGEIRGRRKNGQTFPVWLNITAIRDAERNVFQYIVFFNDITEHKRSEELLRNQAQLDALTGLPTRSLFLEYLEFIMFQAQKMGHGGAVMALVAERGGAVEVNALAPAVAERFKAAVRKEDTLAYLGDGCFALLLPVVTDSQDIAHVAEKLQAAFRHPVMVGGGEMQVTLALGVGAFPGDGTTPEEIIARAEAAVR